MIRLAAISGLFTRLKQWSVTTSLLIGNHPLYFAEVAVAYQRGRSQMAFAFLGLGTQHVAQAGMPAFHLAVGRLLEALGRALVRFQFRHKSS
jgi:hypothetical protein